MIITAILFGLNITKTIKQGAMVFGTDGKDVPTRYFTIKYAAPHGASLVDCAEEMFDLTNNPHRETERTERGYGERWRTFSSGDVVIIDCDGKSNYLICCGMGWADITCNHAEIIAKLDADGTWSGRGDIANSEQRKARFSKLD